MRRLFTIAVIAAVGLMPMIAQSQMRGMGGGGRVSAPARGGVAVRGGPVVAPRVGPAVAPRFVSGGVVGVRTVTPAGVVVRRGPVVVSHGPVVVTRFRSPFFFRVRSPFFFNKCFNGFCGNGFFPFFPGFGFGTGFGFGVGAGYPYYPAPYYPYDYSSPPPYYPPDYYTNAAPQTSTQENANDVYLAQMLQKLTDEVEAMKNEQKSPAGSGVVLGPKAATEGPAATFIFHDGTRITTHNYAVAGQTIWVFSENQARKFRLADLDRAATEQANAANGVELRLPEPAPEH
ncbi:MAG TPA: hypothetical protein VKE93_03020 [Candidatus Angelobacter sp.]|nr:hypothetical protein [Candidatus Angelobacter sp.]